MSNWVRGIASFSQTGCRPHLPAFLCGEEDRGKDYMSNKHQCYIEAKNQLCFCLNIRRVLNIPMDCRIENSWFTFREINWSRAGCGG